MPVMTVLDVYLLFNNIILEESFSKLSECLIYFLIDSSTTMASNENYCLKLNGFEGNAKLYWQELQLENDFCDVTLACEDNQIKTHQLIISSCSPV